MTTEKPQLDRGYLLVRRYFNLSGDHDDALRQVAIKRGVSEADIVRGIIALSLGEMSGHSEGDKQRLLDRYIERGRITPVVSAEVTASDSQAASSITGTERPCGPTQP